MYSDAIILMGLSVVLGVVVLGCDYLQCRYQMYREMKRVTRELRRTRQQ